MSSGKTVLFVSHEASRSGAPIILLNLMKWLKYNTDIRFMALIENASDGKNELLPEFEALCPTLVYWPPRLSSALPAPSAGIAGSIRRVLRRKPVLQDVLRTIADSDVGLIYSNTVGNAAVLSDLAVLELPVLVHVHELEYAMKWGLGSDSFKIVEKAASRFIAVSGAVKRNLVVNHFVSDEKVSLVYGFVPVVPSLPYEGCDRNDVLKELGIPCDALVVGASGSIDPRKGTDMFIQLAMKIGRLPHDRPVHFLWVGGNLKGLYFGALEHDMSKADVAAVMHFTGNVTDPSGYYSAMDVFVLTSREDPFPLVVLEAGALGKPTVCFEASGGAMEFVEPDCGFAVPYLDVDAMAGKTVELLNDDALRGQLGASAAAKVRKRHTLDVGAAQIHNIIKQYLA